jgi:pimeloyl-ACP methyl ester carboxylesterase
MFVRERAWTGAENPSGTLVFVHGLGESGLCFEHLLSHPALEAWTMLIPDLPGYGRSAWPRHPASLEDHADHLAAWLAQRSMRGSSPLARPVTLIGHSMGGVVGILLCERHPDAVEHFIDVDGNLSLDDCVFSRQAIVQDLAEFIATGFQRLCESVYQEGFHDASRRGYYASMRLSDPRSFFRNSQELVQLSAAEALATRMGELRTRSAYIAGIPRGACARSLELLDQEGLHWIGVEDCGHWPFIDRPDEFVAILRELVGRG